MATGVWKFGAAMCPNIEITMTVWQNEKQSHRIPSKEETCSPLACFLMNYKENNMSENTERIIFMIKATCDEMSLSSKYLTHIKCCMCVCGHTCNFMRFQKVCLSAWSVCIYLSILLVLWHVCSFHTAVHHHRLYSQRQSARQDVLSHLPKQSYASTNHHGSGWQYDRTKNKKQKIPSKKQKIASNS